MPPNAGYPSAADCAYGRLRSRIDLLRHSDDRTLNHVPAGTYEPFRGLEQNHLGCRILASTGKFSQLEPGLNDPESLGSVLENFEQVSIVVDCPSRRTIRASRRQKNEKSRVFVRIDHRITRSEYLICPQRFAWRTNPIAAARTVFVSDFWIKGLVGRFIVDPRGWAS